MPGLSASGQFSSTTAMRTFHPFRSTGSVRHRDPSALTDQLGRDHLWDWENKARYVTRMTGIEGEGKITISKASDTLIIADHTFVPDSRRGSGAAAALVQHLIDGARAKGQRIVPLCPFVHAQALKHPEWGDVIQN